ncbi:MAG TPA: hypothetical protein VD927_15310 [Chryseosolibacter sp.]|nr:hypothetical protein [Chryseosolibacter sp.]
MRILVSIIVLICLTSCQMGLIPCPKVRADRMKRSFARKPHPERHFSASSRNTPDIEPRRRNVSFRVHEQAPPLEHIDVEEWDCPKPGTKRTMPKALKDNIRRNKKAYETYYRHRREADTVTTVNRVQTR